MAQNRKQNSDYSEIPPETLRRMGVYVRLHSKARKIHPVIKSFHWTEQRMESLLGWLKELAFLEILGIVSNIGLLFAVGIYIGSEKQRRDAEVLNAWQTITSAYGQSGSGGRVQALEFLNASPADKDYDYSGANWRRRASCLWLCLWPKERLDGINLEANFQEESSSNILQSIHLGNIQLPRASLNYAHARGIFLGGANLQGASFQNANLGNAILWEANLKSANLWDSNLENASLWGANLDGANLGYANLDKAILGSSSFKKANLFNTRLNNADLRQANLERANLSSASLREAFLWEANLEGANLQGANLQGATLSLVNFDKASLRNAYLLGSILRDSILEKATDLTKEQLNVAKLCRTTLPANIDLDSNRDCKELGVDPSTGDFIGM